jgi:hypothetical protein
MSHALARQSYDLLLDCDEGFFRHGKIDLDGLTKVLELRSRYGQAKTALTDPAEYYDPAMRG